MIENLLGAGGREFESRYPDWFRTNSTLRFCVMCCLFFVPLFSGAESGRCGFFWCGKAYSARKTPFAHLLKVHFLVCVHLNMLPENQYVMKNML